MKARAQRQMQLRQLPTQEFLDVDDINDVIQIMRDLRRGQLRGAALLCDAIESDDRIKAVQETRVGALRATPLDVKAASDDKLAVDLAQQLGGVEDLPGEWDRIFPPGVIGDLVRWGTLLGIGVAEIIWPKTKAPWLPRLKVWHPQFIRWDWSTFSYKILTADGELDLPRLDENPAGDGRWLMWCPYGYQEGYKRGLIRALARLYVMRGWDYRDWARWNETKGLGILKAIMPVSENEDVDLQFLTDIANRGSEPVIAVRQGAEGNKYDLQAVEDAGGGEGQKSFQEFKRALDVDIAVLWLGQNLSTESPANGSSSKSLGEVQRATTLDRLKVDAGIAGACFDQVIVPMTQLNYGSADLAPRPVYVTEPPKDQKATGDAMKATGDAVMSMKTAGIPVDERAVGEEFGVPMKTEEQVAAEKAIADEEAAAQLEAQQAAVGGPPGPGDDGGGTPPGAGPPRVPAKKAALRAAIPAAYPRRTFAGLPVAIENAAGTTRVWRDSGPGGQTIGSTKMLHDYGFIEGVVGSDDEELDVYLGPDENAPDVHVVHQLKLKTPGPGQRLSNGGRRNPQSDGDVSDGSTGIEQAERFHAIELQLARRGSSGDPSLGKDAVDRAFGNLEALRDASNSGAFVSKANGLREVPQARAAMLSAMVGLLHDFEVRRIVVESVAVDVVNDLIARKRSPEQALHDYPVLQALAAAVIDEAVLGRSAERSHVAAGILAHEAKLNSSSSWVYDEDKCFLGFPDAHAAKQAFLAHRNDPRAFGGMSTIPIDRFKAKLRRRTGTGKVRASAADMARTTDALVALANRARAAVALRAGKTPSPDRITEAAVRLASQGMASYVTGVRGLMDGLADHPDPFPELKRRLTAYYRKSDPSRLADVVARARIMAQLAGRAEGAG